MSLVPVSSKIITCMPSLNPHNSSLSGHPGCSLTFNSAEFSRHRVADRRLSRCRRHVHQRDGVARGERAAERRRALERSGGIRRHVALTIGKNRRDVLAKRPELVVARVGTGSGHQQVLLQRVDGNAQPLLHVGDFRLGDEHSLRGIHQRECRSGDRHHDDGGNQHLDDREPAFASTVAAASARQSWCVQCASSLDLPRLNRHETGLLRPARHAAEIARAAIALPRDEHLQNDHVVGIGRERLD